MGLLQKLFGKTEKRTGLSNPDDRFVALFGGGRSSSGAVVTESSALRYPAVWAAVNIISGAVGFLPLQVFKRQNGSRERVDKHPTFKLVHRQANKFMSSLVFKRTLTGHLLTWGNGYAEIQRNGRMDAVNLWPLTPDRVKPVMQDGELFYEYRPQSGDTKIIPDADMIHVKGLGFDGFVGYSPIRMFTEPLGVGISAQEYAARFFGNDATPPGALKLPRGLSDDAFKRVKETWQRNQTGPNRHKIAMLEEGMEFVSIGLPAKEAQLLESRQFSISDVARMYQIPLHMLSDLSRATFSNISHQGIEFVNMTLMTWLTEWELELGRKLFTEAEQETMFFKFNVNALVRGDLPTRYKSYATGRNWGWLSVNDVRTLEDMNPIDDGDIYLSPSNMVPSDQLGQEDEPDPPPPDDTEDTEADERLVAAHLVAIRDVCRRIATREASGLHKAADDPIKIAKFKQDHRAAIHDMLYPVAIAAALSFKSQTDVRGFLLSFAETHPTDPEEMAQAIITELRG